MIAESSDSRSRRARKMWLLLQVHSLSKAMQAWKDQVSWSKAAGRRNLADVPGDVNSA